MIVPTNHVAKSMCMLAYSDREWRADLRQQIKSVTAKRGLNASQTEAIALAMVSTVTLWQVATVSFTHSADNHHLGSVMLNTSCSCVRMVCTSRGLYLR